MPYVPCLVSRNVATDTVKNFASSDMETYVNISADFSSRMLFFKQELPCFLTKSQLRALFYLILLVSVKSCKRLEFVQTDQSGVDIRRGE